MIFSWHINKKNPGTNNSLNSDFVLNAGEFCFFFFGLFFVFLFVFRVFVSVIFFYVQNKKQKQTNDNSIILIIHFFVLNQLKVKVLFF